MSRHKSFVFELDYNDYAHLLQGIIHVYSILLGSSRLHNFCHEDGIYITYNRFQATITKAM